MSGLLAKRKSEDALNVERLTGTKTGDKPMPEIREVKKGKEIGYKSPSKSYIWHACIDCGKTRWVQVYKGQPSYTQCGSCRAKLQCKLHPRILDSSPTWKGGRYQRLDGYIDIKLYPNDPFLSMADTQGYAREHRMVKARQIGRCLTRWESVHHINGIRNDNRPENLKLLSPSDHETYTKLCHNCELRKEIRLLSWQVKELTEALQSKLAI